ncbi:hypothetical protein CcaverHIS002_0112120 [Cutaneotrichosporon cavernicola]|uniref:Transmembrane protein n=1 Tax=Cutaneotrichosporon cavernicola TaxID=279322 RepID=A0AA48I350_9TREE|nr:uncharacterized protein CcaverHIS019_0112000 [Cutaneotrichosporon cavernicola]BEI80683.1 hypothetical protein CcaverHIS002_0112120 [Cutaneotrichosporon cavernicola]BEI88482.1 hypothetical protein CcaverHIS019_0112000 [Cutaneotrichosporon cavernicola]BEI96255.1 hypothetical protein CcaverHIS631_0112040 [Cutaneotrichosporon cavernicola]BEJ04026.1 hypothetical protein CcaverHIS641_0112010 [Cutaneotrichosporon cavernicola]
MWHLGLGLLAIAEAAPIQPDGQHLGQGRRAESESESEPKPAQSAQPTLVARQIQGDTADASSPSTSDVSSKIGVIAPILIAGLIAVAVVYFLFWDRKRKKHIIPTNMSAEELAMPLATNAAPNPRSRRRGLNIGGGLGRSESGRSIRTLPEYTSEAGDEERVLLRRDPSLSSAAREDSRRRSDMSGLSVVTEGTDVTDGDVTPRYWGDAPSYDLGYGYGFGDEYHPPNEPPPPGAHVVPSGAEPPAMRSLSMVTATSNPSATTSIITASTASEASVSPSMATPRAARTTLPPITIPPTGTPAPTSASTVTESPSMLTARSALSTPTRRNPAHSTPPPARSASYAASHRSISTSRQELVRAASAPPIAPSRAGVARTSEPLREVMPEEVEDPEVLGDQPGRELERAEVRLPVAPVPTPSEQNAPTLTNSASQSGTSTPTPSSTPTGPGGWSRLRRISPW